MVESRFQAGDLVKHIDEEIHRVYDVMRVLSVEWHKDADQYEYLLAVGNDDSVATRYESELVLVRRADNIIVEDVKQMEATTSKRTVDQIHQDICEMFAQIANYMADRLDGESCTLKVESEFNSLSNNHIDVKFSAKVRYNDAVETDDLYKSARIAIDRYQEDESLAPRRITLHREA